MRDILLTAEAFALPPVVEMIEEDFKAFLTPLIKDYNQKNPLVQNNFNHFNASLYNPYSDPYSGYTYRSSGFNIPILPPEQKEEDATLCYDRADKKYERQLEAIYADWRKIVRGYASYRWDKEGQKILQTRDYDLELGIDNLKGKLYASSSCFQGANAENSYADSKLAVEQIAFLIKDYPLEKKQNYLCRLGRKIHESCGPGLYTLLADTVYALRSDESIPFWLANDRQVQLELLGEALIDKNGTSDCMSMHTHIAFQKVAAKQGWGVPVSDKLKDFHDQHRTTLSAEEERALIQDFERVISREHVIDVVRDKYRGIFFHYSQMDLDDADNLTALNHVLAQFELDGKPLSSNEVLESGDNYKTVFRADFFDKVLPKLVENLLESEGIIVSLNSPALVKKKQQIAEAEALSSIHSKRQALKALMPDIPALVLALSALPKAEARQALKALSPELPAYFTNAQLLVDAMYQLPVETGRMLGLELGLFNTKAARSHLNLHWQVDRIDYVQRQKLIKDNHPLACRFDRSKEYINVEGVQEFVTNELITPLWLERQRLANKYGPRHLRVEALDRTMRELRTEMAREDLNKLKLRTVCQRVENILDRNLLSHQQMVKHKSWAMALVIGLTNILFAGLLFVPATLKYALTGTCFFSIQGKSQANALEVYAKAADLREKPEFRF